MPFDCWRCRGSCEMFLLRTVSILHWRVEHCCLSVPRVTYCLFGCIADMVNPFAQNWTRASSYGEKHRT
ncbi:hypothetical protein Y1Q_0011646 [Alligator mississippiensis]|uniref:Uncharacterized protein n=1 Tax=Alligator mississippiensis TaxID=8496 RepID=A0A151M0K5_ALLMI|nr:hypothetical protein Y1Q_0011646 [Alligator mississippiensis]